MVKGMLLALSSVLLVGAAARAEDPVSFTDKNLKAAVEDELWIADPTPTDMLGLIYLNALGQGITSLEGLQYAGNLQVLALRDNEISDLTPLAGLIQLESLTLSENQIGDLGPLSGLVHLTTLDLHDNPGISNISAVAGMVELETFIIRFNSVSDISPLAGLSHLEHADLWENYISDISPLLGLTSLRYLDLRYNPLSQSACDTYIPQIQANNPGINIAYTGCTDVRRPRQIVISSGRGGAVTNPGEGRFTYEKGTVLQLVATPDPGYVFAGWLGYSSPQNPLSMALMEDVQIQATFTSLRNELYVDDDAWGDPGPRDPTLSDPEENGALEHPFDSIQEAVEIAAEGASVLVRPGTYTENLELFGRNIRLIGMDPNEPVREPWPVIEGTQHKPVVRFPSGLRSPCLLRGFVITRGRGQPAAAILCDGASPTITHCLIAGNRTTDPNGAVIYCRDSRAVLTHCTIADNYAGGNGAGLVLLDSDVTVTDSILWNNGPAEVHKLGTSTPLIRYCDVRGWWADYGNLNLDPRFAQPGHWASPTNPDTLLAPSDPQAVWVPGDYHLQSEAGRWDPAQQVWVQDAVSSPCLDAGEKTAPVGSEPLPNGGRVNMGVYGGTTEASLSPSRSVSLAGFIRHAQR